jgi:uncharacterized protein YaaN involved in tellurite resistance
MTNNEKLEERLENLEKSLEKLKENDFEHVKDDIKEIKTNYSLLQHSVSFLTSQMGKFEKIENIINGIILDVVTIKSNITNIEKSIEDVIKTNKEIFKKLEIIEDKSNIKIKDIVVLLLTLALGTAIGLVYKK